MLRGGHGAVARVGHAARVRRRDVSDGIPALAAHLANTVTARHVNDQNGLCQALTDHRVEGCAEVSGMIVARDHRRGGVRQALR